MILRHGQQLLLLLCGWWVFRSKRKVEEVNGKGEKLIFIFLYKIMINLPILLRQMNAKNGVISFLDKVF